MHNVLYKYRGILQAFYLYFELHCIIKGNFSKSSPLDVLAENDLYVSIFYLLRMSLNMFILIQRS